MSTSKLTEATIRGLASAQSFSRGEEYYEVDAIVDLVQRGDTLQAEVEGSSYEPYDVTIELDAGGVVDASCSCPYDWGGFCKHIVAVLLTYVRKPDSVIERRPVDELLADLDRDELLDLLTKLLSDHPHLSNWVEVQLELAAKTEPSSSSPSATDEPRRRQTPLDPKSFRRQAQNIVGGLSRMRPSEAYWATGGMVDELRGLIHQAQPFSEAGDGRSALVILEAVTQVYVDRWVEFDDSDGYLGEFFAEFGPLFAEAMLSADLSPKERQAWASKLTVWQDEIEPYGIDEGFQAAIAAAEQGWDDPPLQQAMQGHAEKGAWEGEAPWYADDLAMARLNVLERQGKTTAYLNLAEAEGQTAKYVTMLVKLGRSQEAIEYGQRHLVLADEALELAQALHEHDRPQDALHIAEHGLTLQGDIYALACWLRDLAAGLEQPKVALSAARAAFADSCALEDYQAVQAIAGAQWPSVKAELLERLDSTRYASGRIDIYLHEGMVDAAIHTIDQGVYFGYDTLEQVVDAACQSHPDWAIRQCKTQAERIMDSGKSKHYHHAARWLEKARQAYLAAERAAEWCAYLEDLIKLHARKYALRPRLEALRE